MAGIVCRSGPGQQRPGPVGQLQLPDRDRGQKLPAEALATPAAAGTIGGRQGHLRGRNRPPQRYCLQWSNHYEIKLGSALPGGLKPVAMPDEWSWRSTIGFTRIASTIQPSFPQIENDRRRTVAVIRLFGSERHFEIGRSIPY